MRAGIAGVVVVVAAVVGAAVWIHRPGAAAESTAGYRAPRTADGKPDLNGIWQALNSANFDLQAHAARPAAVAAAAGAAVVVRPRRSRISGAALPP